MLEFLKRKIKKMKHKILSNKGSVEMLAFILLLPMQLSIAYNPTLMNVNMYQYNGLEDIAKKYCLVMETQGGMTDTEYNAMMSDIISKGFDAASVHVDYTPYPVDFGNNVSIKIQADMEMKRFKTVKGGLDSEKVTVIAGPFSSISKRVVQQ